MVDMAKPNNRPSNPRAGVKVLIAVASVGCTLGGWMYFAGTVPPVTSTAAAQPAQISVQYAAQPVVLPTLVPIDDAIAASNATSAQAQAPQPVLRSVTIPQGPVAMSRSSQ
jgi:hypothetical protein